MVDRQQFQLAIVHLTKSVQLFIRVAQITIPGVRLHVCQRIDGDGLILFPGDEPTGLVRRFSPGVTDQLG